MSSKWFSSFRLWRNLTIKGQCWECFPPPPPVKYRPLDPDFSDSDQDFVPIRTHEQKEPDPKHCSQHWQKLGYIVTFLTWPLGRPRDCPVPQSASELCSPSCQPWPTHNAIIQYSPVFRIRIQIGSGFGIRIRRLKKRSKMSNYICCNHNIILLFIDFDKILLTF